MPKPRGKTIPSLKYSIKHHGLNHFGLAIKRGIGHDLKDKKNL
jgi:hypothetical protein